MKNTVKKITAKEAEKIMDRLGLCYGDDGTTFYVYEKCASGKEQVYDFYSIRERNEFLAFRESIGDEVIG